MANNKQVEEHKLHVKEGDKVIIISGKDKGKTGSVKEVLTKDNKVIVMAINAKENDRELKIKLPFKVKSGIIVQSLGNEAENLCQQKDIVIDEPITDVIVELPYQSLNTYILTLDESTAIEGVRQTGDGAKTYYDLHGRKINNPRGLCIERSADGTLRKVIMKR